ncbi:MAG: peptide chain release factor N(5)-glutamine methyltransferase [Smithella sp.]
MTIHDILNESTTFLERSGFPSARLDAEVLLAFYLECDRLDFFKNPEMALGEKQLAGYRNLITRRLKWEPVAYITGQKNFWTFSLQVSEDVLIPRPDTEIIVEEALDMSRKMASLEISILDIGTGSGAIALALASEISSARVTATDFSAAALALARKNARSLKLEDKIEFLQGDLLEPVEGAFDMIVCNPPYISESEYAELPAGVKDYEPPIALLAGKDGMEFYEKLIHQAPDYLKKNGWLLLEIGAKQEIQVRGLMEESGSFDSIAMRRDYAGLPRVMKARRK